MIRYSLYNLKHAKLSGNKMSALQELVIRQFLNKWKEMSSHRITQPAELWTLTSEGEQ